MPRPDILKPGLNPNLIQLQKDDAIAVGLPKNPNIIDSPTRRLQSPLEAVRIGSIDSTPDSRNVEVRWSLDELPSPELFDHLTGPLQDYSEERIDDEDLRIGIVPFTASPQAGRLELVRQKTGPRDFTEELAVPPYIAIAAAAEALSKMWVAEGRPDLHPHLVAFQSADFSQPLVLDNQTRMVIKVPITDKVPAEEIAQQKKLPASQRKDRHGLLTTEELRAESKILGHVVFERDGQAPQAIGSLVVAMTDQDPRIDPYVMLDAGLASLAEAEASLRPDTRIKVLTIGKGDFTKVHSLTPPNSFTTAITRDAGTLSSIDEVVIKSMGMTALSLQTINVSAIQPDVRPAYHMTEYIAWEAERNREKQAARTAKDKKAQEKNKVEPEEVSENS